MVILKCRFKSHNILKNNNNHKSLRGALHINLTFKFSNRSIHFNYNEHLLPYTCVRRWQHNMQITQYVSSKKYSPLEYKIKTGLSFKKLKSFNKKE